MLLLCDFLFTACKDEPVQLRAPRKVCIIYGVSGMQQYLRVIVTKNQRNRGHGRKIDFAHTLPV